GWQKLARPKPSQMAFSGSSRAVKRAFLHRSTSATYLVSAKSLKKACMRWAFTRLVIWHVLTTAFWEKSLENGDWLWRASHVEKMPEAGLTLQSARTREPSPSAKSTLTTRTPRMLK